MYTIYADGRALFSPDLVNEGYGVINPKITMELNKVGSLSFILPPTNVMYDDIQKLKTIISVYEDDEEIFRGRVLNDEKDFYNRKNVYCEGELAFLFDSIQRPYSFKGTIQELLTQFIENHNEQVEEEKRFAVGIVTVTDSNDYINRSNTNYSNTWDAINDKLIKTHGGYIRTRLVDGIRYIDLIAEYGKNSQVIEFSVNMLDISEYITAEDVFTCLIPLGAKQKKGTRLTIKSVNNDIDYIQNETAISLFGYIWRTKEWDDVTDANNLLTKGKAYLQSGIEMAVSLNLKAVDMHLLNVDVNQIKLGYQIRTVSLPHKLDDYFLCSKVVKDLVNADKSEYTLGFSFATMTEKQISNEKITKGVVVEIQNSVVEVQDVAIAAQQSIEQVKSILPTDYVSITTFEEYKEEVNNKISAVYHVKGSVAEYAALPSSNRKIGDVWNVLDTGSNYVWTDTGWDKLSETVDLTIYALKEDIPITAEQYQDILNRLTALESEE